MFAAIRLCGYKTNFGPFTIKNNKIRDNLTFS
nr:MAG TPA: hypothetical protein [Bacteriophage sp.]